MSGARANSNSNERFAGGQPGASADPARLAAPCARVLSWPPVMVQFNFNERTIKAKVVYYGPAQSGKTTNLEQIHSRSDPAGTSRLISLNTAQDRTLFFDLLPFSLGAVAGYDFKVQLYTIPGQVQYNATRRVVLAGADAVVFVADARKSLLKENQAAFENMKVNLLANRLVPEKMPLVLQYNKQDLPDILTEDELNRALNPWGRRVFAAVASAGQGVMETFVAVVQEMLTAIAVKYNLKEKGLDPAAVPAIVTQAFAEVLSGAARVARRRASRRRPPTASPSSATGWRSPATRPGGGRGAGRGAVGPDRPVPVHRLAARRAAPGHAGGGPGLGGAAAPLDPLQRRAGGGPRRAGAGHEPRAGDDPLPRRAAAPATRTRRARSAPRAIAHHPAGGHPPARAGPGAGHRRGGVRAAPPGGAARDGARRRAASRSSCARCSPPRASPSTPSRSRWTCGSRAGTLPPSCPPPTLHRALAETFEGLAGAITPHSQVFVRCERKPVLFRGPEGEVKKDFLMVALAHNGTLSAAGSAEDRPGTRRRTAGAGQPPVPRDGRVRAVRPSSRRDVGDAGLPSRELRPPHRGGRRNAPDRPDPASPARAARGRDRSSSRRPPTPAASRCSSRARGAWGSRARSPRRPTTPPRSSTTRPASRS